MVPNFDLEEKGKIEPDSVGVRPRRRSKVELTWEDILIAYATIPGYVANRNRYRGSWFIECLCEVTFLTPTIFPKFRISLYGLEIISKIKVILASWIFPEILSSKK